MIEVGGVGLKVSVTPQLALSLPVGSVAHLHTTLIVREDDLALFGFSTADELQVFDLLRGVTRRRPEIRPRRARPLDADADRLGRGERRRCPHFRRVSGIGPKTAKLIVVQLTGKLDIRIQVPSVTQASTTSADVLVALVGLGWSERDAQSAIDAVVDEADPSVTAAVPRPLARDSDQARSPARERAVMSADLTQPELESEAELAYEGALRPKSLTEFVGQTKVRGQLELLLKAAEMQSRSPDHILLAGPPGLGKTTLAMIVAHEGNSATAHVVRARYSARRRPRSGVVVARARRGALHR